MTTTFTLNPRKVGMFLGVLSVVMSALAITGDLLELHFDSGGELGASNPFIWPFARQFNFVEEGNLANFYQGFQLALAAVLLFTIWRGKARSGEPMKGRWLALGLIFLFLGADEVAQIHETTVANTIAGLRQDESDKTGWFWLYLPLLAVFGLSYIPFLRHLPGKIAVLFMGAGSIYVGGAIGVEKFVNWYAGQCGDDNVGYVLLDNLGEFMESTGIALFVYALVSYLAFSGTEIRILSGSKPTETK